MKRVNAYPARRRVIQDCVKMSEDLPVPLEYQKFCARDAAVSFMPLQPKHHLLMASSNKSPPKVQVMFVSDKGGIRVCDIQPKLLHRVVKGLLVENIYVVADRLLGFVHSS